MMSYDRKEHLHSLHTKRKASTHERVDAAILRLIKSHIWINFNSVAKESGISKTTLYNNADIRKNIEDLRFQESQVPSPTMVKREMDEQSKDAVLASLKRKIRKLEEENKLLKEQIKHNYSEYYEKV